MALNLPDELVLLSDYNRDFGNLYGLTWTTPTGLKGVLRRSVFVIGRDGIIAYRWDVPDPPGLPNPDDALAALRRLPESPVVGRQSSEGSD